MDVFETTYSVFCILSAVTVAVAFPSDPRTLQCDLSRFPLELRHLYVSKPKYCNNASRGQVSSKRKRQIGLSGYSSTAMHFGRFCAYISALTNLSQRWTTLAHIQRQIRFQVTECNFKQVTTRINLQRIELSTHSLNSKSNLGYRRISQVEHLKQKVHVSKRNKCHL
jgi:hypothetical protein